MSKSITMPAEQWASVAEHAIALANASKGLADETRQLRAEVERLRAALRGVVVELRSPYTGAKERAAAIAEIALESTSPSPPEVQK